MIGPFFKYFGSKWRVSIVTPEPQHNTIVEPFAGSACYSLRHYKKDVILYETHQPVVELWRWLIYSATKQDILDIPLTKDVPAFTPIDTLPLSKGQQLLLQYNQRTNNNTSRTTADISHFINGGWTAGKRAMVAQYINAIKHWQIFQLDGMTAFHHKNATYEVDPPYSLYGHKYYKQMQRLDYDMLAKHCLSMRSQVIVHESTAKDGTLPAYLPFQSFNKQFHRNDRMTNPVKELIWTNK